LGEQSLEDARVRCVRRDIPTERAGVTDAQNACRSIGFDFEIPQSNELVCTRMPESVMPLQLGASTAPNCALRRRQVGGKNAEKFGAGGAATARHPQTAQRGQRSHGHSSGKDNTTPKLQVDKKL